MKLAEPTWTLDGYPITVGAASCSDTAGGYDQMRGVVAAGDWLEAAARGADQGSLIVGWSHGEVIWAGRLAVRPMIAADGMAAIAAQGHKHAAAKYGKRLFIQSLGTEGWTSAESDPHLNSNGTPVYPASTTKRMESFIQRSRIHYRVEDLNITNGQATAVVFWAEGVNIGRVSWRQAYVTADETSNLQIRLLKANGPVGSSTSVNTRATSAGNNGATFDELLSGTAVFDAVILALEVASTFTPTNPGIYRISNLKVNSDVNTTDVMTGAEVAAHIATTMGWTLGTFDENGTTVLPFDDTSGDWLGAALYVGQLNQRAFRVGYDPLAGVVAEYVAWGRRTWTTSQGAGAVADLTPLERYDRARVSWEAVSGAERQTTVTSSEYPALGNTFDFELADTQPDADLATEVAEALLEHYAQQRYAGSVVVPNARSDDGWSDPRQIRYGDVLVISDFGPSESLAMRVVEVQQGSGAPIVTVERSFDVDAFVAIGGEPERRRRRRRKVRR